MNFGGGAAGRAWLVAASIGAVEALKDQGVARWNGPLRAIHHHAKTKLISSYYKTTADLPGRSLIIGSEASSSLSAAISAGKYRVERRKDVSMRKVMDMSCFGPNTVRF